MTITDKSYDTIDASYSLVDMDGPITYGSFSGLAGGDMSVSMISYQTIGENGGVETRYLPGQTAYAPLTLSRTFTPQIDNMLEWYKEVKAGNTEKMKRNCSLTLHLVSGDDLVRWDLYNVMPISISGLSVTTAQRDVVSSYKVVLQVERIEITVVETGATTEE